MWQPWLTEEEVRKDDNVENEQEIGKNILLPLFFYTA
jgi:hypothetical protein